MNFIILSIILVVLFFVNEKFKVKGKGKIYNGGGSKCFDCEVQDLENGIYRDYGSKCFDCEIQDRQSGIIRSYGQKWF